MSIFNIVIDVFASAIILGVIFLVHRAQSKGQEKVEETMKRHNYK